MPTRDFPIPQDDGHRLQALDRYEVFNTAPEAEFDHIARLAVDLFQVPTALVSFVGRDRQSFKARVGFEACDTSRDISFCAHTIMNEEVLVVPDACQDERFRENPLVTSKPFIRFYAGAPLRTKDGFNIGSLCIIDRAPHPDLTPHQKNLLRSLAILTMDLLEKRRLEVLKRAAMRMSAATPDAIVCWGADGIVTFWNAGAEATFGYGRAEAMGQMIETVVSPQSRAVLRGLVANVCSADHSSHTRQTVEIAGLRKDGSELPTEISLAYWSDGDRDQFGAIIRDITNRRRSHERLRQLTHFDRLTGLPNRVSFLERIEQALGNGLAFAVLKVGLDGFRAINGSLGMSAGDDVLRYAAKRVASAVDPGAFVARLAGDEFGVLLCGSDDPRLAQQAVNSIAANLREPFQVHGSTSHVTASVGVVLSPGLSQFEDADAVLKAALLALHHAKSAGRRRYEFFRPQLGQAAEARRLLEEQLRKAFERREFELFYQPQVLLQTNQIVGAEALLRWRHPTRGLLSPAAFLSTLETSEASVAVGRWILETACSFAAENSTPAKPVRMGVNLFAAQLRDPALVETIKHALTQYCLSPNWLELEITETTILGLDEETVTPVKALRELGLGIAFDDYGTGFASLSLLKRYPLTRLKIDREFVRDLESDPDDAAIVKAVLALGSSLGLDVIAEGIETREQAAILIDLGCTEGQGYLFGRPMPANEFEEVLTQRSADQAA